MNEYMCICSTIFSTVHTVEYLTAESPAFSTPSERSTIEKSCKILPLIRVENEKFPKRPKGVCTEADLGGAQ